MSEAAPVHPDRRIPRVDRDRIGEIYAITPGRRRRPVAHILSIFGWTAGGPTYSLECRAPADDFEKACAAWILCECEPVRLTRGNMPDENAPCPKSPTGRHRLYDGLTVRPAPGCATANLDEGEDLDDPVRDLIQRHDLHRGIFLVEAHGGNGDEVILTLLGRITNMVGETPGPSGLSARPTTAMRYPGFGPEVELRELIEQTLSDTEGAVVWDDDEAALIVDANAAATAVLRWVEGRYDVPPDQLSFADLPARRPAIHPRRPIASIHVARGML